MLDSPEILLGCPAHRKALGVIAAPLYAAKKSITVTAGLRQPAAMLQSVTLDRTREKSAPAMRLFARIL